MIILKSRQEIEKIHKACQVVAAVLDDIQVMIRPGVTTQALDEFAEKVIVSSGARPAFKGYRGYPRTLCTSLNNEVVHGIPSKKVILKDGDIISIDVGAIVEDFYGDAAKTFSVGNAAPESKRLITITEEALYKGIAAAVAGGRLYDISSAVQRHVESRGYSVVREFVGHGIGRNMHEDPQIPNFGEPGQGPKIKSGMVFAIEPMVNMGGSATLIKEDGWTAVTVDGSLSAHFEHTVAVMPEGPWILTRK